MLVIHWLFDVENPIKLYGIVPFTIWICVFLNWGLTFGVPEYAGANNWHGMCYATDILRCLPRIFWIFAAAIAIWHFDLVRTVTKAVTGH